MPMIFCARRFPYLASCVLCTAFACDAQWLNHPTPGLPRLAGGKPDLNAPAPRAADGKPDLSGVWNRISPKYRINIAADLKPEEIRLAARTLAEQRSEDLGKGAMNALCVPSGPAYTTDADSTAGGMMKIIQTPSVVIILNPDMTYRQIYLDGRKLEASPNPSWMGYSVGHWDGDALVVESNGFNDRTWLDTSGHPHTENLRMTERYRRRNTGNLDIEVTLDDPAYYTRSWTVAVHAQLAPDTELIEYVCNEERNETQHWIGRASDDARNEVKIAPEKLSKYVGTYVEQPPLWRIVPRTVEVSIKDGALYGNLDGRGEERQYASSETLFSGFAGLAMKFVIDANGEINTLMIQHVSGDYRFAKEK